MKAYRNMLRRKLTGFTLVEIMIVVLIIGILLAIAIPNFISARESARAKACVANLKQIDAAKQQWLMDNKAADGPSAWQTADLWAPADAGQSTDASEASSLVPTYIRSIPGCPEGGSYTINDGATLPTCSIGANSNPQDAHVIQ